MSRSTACIAFLTCMLILIGVLPSCRPQNAPGISDPSIENPKDSVVPTPSPTILPIPICEGMPDSLADMEWLRTTYRFGSSEKKRTVLHTFLQESFSSPSSFSSSLSLSYNPVCRGPLTTWSAMCDPMPASAAPEALSALIPRGTVLIVETTYPDGSMTVVSDVPYQSVDLGFSFTSIGHDAYLYALRDTLTALISRGSLPQVTCIFAYPYKDNLLEE